MASRARSESCMLSSAFRVYVKLKGFRSYCFGYRVGGLMFRLPHVCDDRMTIGDDAN